ncbi:MAG: DUF411 domain-containing protein [Gemmatimonadota bacterium]
MGSRNRWTAATAAVLGAAAVAAVMMAGRRSGEADALSTADTLSATDAVPASPPASNIRGAKVTVYKSPTCGCCSKWVDHLRKSGFEVVALDVTDLVSVKARHGVPPELSSCHTATVEGYVIEGHVPADLIARLLEERPEVAGLAVPGMPMGSPGMEGARKDPYDILAFDREGNARVYASR